MLNTTKIEKIQVCMSFIVLVFSETILIFQMPYSSFLRDCPAISLFTWFFPAVPDGGGVEAVGL